MKKSPISHISLPGKTVICLIVIITAALCSVTASAAPQARVRTFNIHDGMPSNYVTNIVQDSLDRIWIATWNGISMYDGYRFVNFHDRTGGMSSNRIVQLLPGAGDVLWVLPYEKHPYMMDVHTGTFTPLSKIIGEELTVNQMQMRGDTLWLKCQGDCRSVTGIPGDKPKATKHPLSQYTKGTPGGNFSNHHTPRVKGKIEGVPSGSANYLDSRGRLWSLARDGVVRLREKSEGTFREVATAPSPGGVTVCAQPLWLEDPYGNVWLGAKGQPFSYFDEQSGMLVPYPLPSRVYNNAPIPAIEVALVDRQKNLWISPMHNLTLVNFSNSNLREVGAERLSDTRSVAVAPDGSVWMGTTDGTLCRYTADGAFVCYLSGSETGRLTQNQSPVKFADRVYALMPDSKGTMWIGTKGRGLYAVAPDGRIESFLAKGAPGDLPNNNIYDIDEDPAGNIWIATYGGGIALLRAIDNIPGQRRFYSSANGLPGYPKQGFERVRRITHTPGGVMAASTTDGLLTFDGRHSSPSAIQFFSTIHSADRQTGLNSNHLMHTLATSDGSLYLAPLGEEVVRVASGNMLTSQLACSPLTHDDSPHPFLSDHSPAGNVLSMVEGRDGMIYLVLESCVLAYSPTSGAAHSIGYRDFDNTIEYTEAKAVCHPVTGHLWVPAARGCVVIDPAKSSRADFIPRIMVTANVEDDSTLYVDPERIVLPAGASSLTLTMASLDYSTHELIQYAYRLDNGDWINTGAAGVVSLSGLAPGHHTLSVRGTNADGVWTDASTEIAIYVTPLFWQSGTGRSLIFLIVLTVLVAAVYLLYVWQKHPIANMLAKKKIMQESVLAQISGHSQTNHPDIADGSDAGAENADDSSDDSSTLPSAGAGLTKADRKLLHRLNTYIATHLTDEKLRIDDIADAMKMSRSALYARIKDLTGLSPADFLRHLRMQRARHLMVDTDLTVSEIAYSVGFSDPKYFAKCFKKDTGLTPTEYRLSEKDKQDSR